MNNSLLRTAEMSFVIITIVFLTLFMMVVKKGINDASWSQQKKAGILRTIATTLILWFVFVTIWSGSGLMADFSLFPINFLPVLLVPLAGIVGTLIFSKTLGEIIQHIPATAIVNLQCFRVFVEITLWILFVANVIPRQMTFEGINFDILAGISGPIIGFLIRKNKISRRGIIVWNVAGLSLLINIVAVAILSTPSPIRLFFNEPANTIVTTFPSVLLPAFLVPLAYTLHVISLKQALQLPSDSGSRQP